MKNKGCVHIYCGDGKGKTTAAVGLAVRAAGNGWKVLFYQFMKDNESGERGVLEQIPGITMVEGLAMEKFSFQMTEQEKEERRQFYEEQFHGLVEIAQDGDCRMLVLDEVIYTIRAGLFSEELLLEFMHNRPEELEVVLTGQGPGEALTEAADYVSEICKRKHPFDEGMPARTGVER